VNSANRYLHGTDELVRFGKTTPQRSVVCCQPRRLRLHLGIVLLLPPPLLV
jgi:hypothetical protein